MPPELAEAEVDTEASEESQLLDGQDVQADSTEEVVDVPVDSGEVAPAPDEPVQPTFVETLGQRGFQDLQDDNQGQERLLEAYEQQQYAIQQLQQQVQQSQGLAQYGNQFLELQRNPEFLSWQSKSVSSEPDASTPTAEAGQSWWKAPEITYENVERYREQDTQSGQWKWKSGTPAKIRTDWEDYDAYVTQWAEDLTRRPHEVLPPIIEQIVDQRIAQSLQSHVSEQRDEQFAEHVMQANSDWLYARDPRTGQTAMDGYNKPIPSQGGQLVLGYVNQASQMGISQPQDQWNYAVGMAQRDLLTQQYQGQAQPEQQPEQANGDGRRKRHQQSALNRGGSMPPTEQPNSTPQNPNLSGGQQLAEQLTADGFFSDR